MMIGAVYGREHVDAALHHSDERIRDCAKVALFNLYNENPIVTGMEEKEVVRLLGRPKDTRVGATGKRFLEYRYFVVEIVEGKVTAVKRDRGKGRW